MRSEIVNQKVFIKDEGSPKAFSDWAGIATPNASFLEVKEVR